MAGRGPDRDRGAGAGRRLGRLGGGGRLGRAELLRVPAVGHLRQDLRRRPRRHPQRRDQPDRQGGAGQGRLPVQRPVVVRAAAPTTPTTSASTACSTTGQAHPDGRGPRQPGADRRRLARERAQGHLEQRHRAQRPVHPRRVDGEPSPSCRRSPGTRSTSGSWRPLRLGVRRRRHRDRPGGPGRHHRHRPQQDPGHLAQQAGGRPRRPVHDRAAGHRPVHGAHAAAPGRPRRPGERSLRPAGRHGDGSSGAPACRGRRRWRRRSSRARTASPAPPGCSSPARCSGGCATCAPSPSTTCCPPAARTGRSARPS